MTKILKLGLNGLNRTAKPTRGQSIVESMTGNPYFVGPDIAALLLTLGTASTDLQNKNETAENGKRSDVSAARAAEVVWDTAYRAVATYVEGKAIANAANAATIILSAGYEVRKNATPAPLP